MRAGAKVEKCRGWVQELELGDKLEVVTDLEQETIRFTVWPSQGSSGSSFTVAFGQMLAAFRTKASNTQATCGYLAVVVKNAGVSVNMCSQHAHQH